MLFVRLLGIPETFAGKKRRGKGLRKGWVTSGISYRIQIEVKFQDTKDMKL